MLCEVPLTKEQQTFATAHHSLVYKFLNENRLPEDEFYDVVIFGYLKAVRDYFSDLTAQQFTFSTIANRRMKFCLFDYFRTQERRKRNMEILSIHVGLYPDKIHPLSVPVIPVCIVTLKRESQTQFHILIRLLLFHT